MDFQNAVVMIAGGIVFMAMCLLLFPSVFIYADLIAICISMNVFLVGMNVGPILWKKIEELATNAMLIAIAAMAIAVHQVILRIIGGDYWLRLYANGSFTVLAGLTCGFIFFLRSG